MSKYICRQGRPDADRACPTVGGPIGDKLLLALSKLCMWEVVERGQTNCAYAANFTIRQF